mmetsp:Transcript_39638/g.93381  ORF Transcript_39638/g.93381 Transcript_39638/m.93381 type:complete len:997 (+) Transcript_39638:31-3021(+)
MLGFFGWPGIGGGANSSSSTSSSALPRNGAAEAGQSGARLLQELLNLAEEPENPLVSPLKSTVVLVAKAFYGRGIPDPALADELRATASFLGSGEQSSQRLEFALSSYTDDRGDVQKFMRIVEKLLQRIFAQPQSSRWAGQVSSGGYPPAQSASSLQEAVAQWRGEVQAFRALCKRVWELHFYLVFLETKGDRVLFEQTCRLLCTTLEIPVCVLSLCLPRTRNWVENCLVALAQQHERDLLCRCHSEALRAWLKTQESEYWKAEGSLNSYEKSSSGQAAEEESEGAQPEEDAESQLQEALQQGMKFWESNFTHLFKITWPDFVEAFENFYLVGQCPLDVVAQLRLRVDPCCRYQVQRDAWHQLLRKSGRVRHLVRTLVDEVLEDPGTRIYRQAVLKAYPPLEDTADQSSPRAEQTAASPGGQGRLDSSAAAPSRARPWFPFAHSLAEDNDMAIPTPHDTPLLQRPDQSHAERQPPPTMAWNDWVARLCTQSRPWWVDASQGQQDLVLEEDHPEPKRIAALRAVHSCMAYTRRALVFRVIMGDLAQNNPILELPKSSSSRSSGRSTSEQVTGEVAPRPCLVVTANGTRFNGVTKFGRGSSRRTLLPDCPMSEPIASRSHFNVVYQQETDQYYLMDAGSKWGTFVKIGNGLTLACGDWIRVGGVEFIVRFCGGGCSCHEKHIHYRLHSLRLLREHKIASSAFALAGSESLHKNGGPRSGPGNDSDSDEKEEQCFQDELVMMLSSRRPCGWTTSSARLCQHSAMSTAGLQSLPQSEIDGPTGMDRRRQREVEHLASLASKAGGQGLSGPVSATMLSPTAVVDSSSPSKPPLRPRKSSAAASTGSSSLPNPKSPATQVPVAPLELDFISGPRMGEKLVLSERICTLGRGEGNTIQVNDSQLVSVSRVHCIFEYRGNRWHMRDNSSTNGTWKRLSCVLEPSDPIPLHGGLSIQAGVHEFLVEEAEMRNWWLPSLSVTSFDELCVEPDVRIPNGQARSRPSA